MNNDDVKKVINVLLQNFAREEAGNRVTSNNMMALTMNIFGALDGKVTISKPPAAGETIE